MKIEIIDDFFSSYKSDSYDKTFSQKFNEFPWFFQNDLNGVSYLGNCYFNHVLIDNFIPTATADKYFYIFVPLLSKLNLTTKNNSQYDLERLLRLKVNLYPRTQRRVHHSSHMDYRPNLGLRTCLYYVNTNNGFTIFDGKRKIGSKKNRAILFDGSNKHHSTTPTDCNYRCSINIDYKV